MVGNNQQRWPFISSGMKGMMGGSSLETVSRYARWFLDGSCWEESLCSEIRHHLLNSLHHIYSSRVPAESAWCLIGNAAGEIKWVTLKRKKNQLLQLTIRLSNSPWNFLNLLGSFCGKVDEFRLCVESPWITPTAGGQLLTSQVWFNLHTAGLLSPMMMAKKAFRFLYSLQLWSVSLVNRCCKIHRKNKQVLTGLTYWAAILRNFLRSCTLLLSCVHRHTSVITQNWISLNLLRNRSRFTVVFFRFCLPNAL